MSPRLRTIWSSAAPWPRRRCASTDSPSVENSRDFHEIRQDRFLDRWDLGRVGAPSLVFHLRSDRAQRSATHHPSRVLLWLRQRGAGLPDGIHRDRQRSGAPPLDDDSFGAREIWLRRYLERAISAESPAPARSRTRRH